MYAWCVYNTTLLEPQAYATMLERLEKLTPQSQAQWGKMDVAQMLAHLAATLELAMSSKPTSWSLIGRLFGGGAKREILAKGFSKNSPTDTSIKISNACDFAQEKQRLLTQLERFKQGGEAGLTRQPNAFFGPMTPDERARMQYQHLDHHFKQFGA